MTIHWEGYRQNIVSTLGAIAPANQIVAERNGNLVGAVLLYPAAAGEPGALPEVRLLAVRPGARGGGIGAAVMTECIRRARAAGAPALGLHTTDVMRAAVRLYEGLGFAVDPSRDFEVAPGLVVKAYRLDLPS